MQFRHLKASDLETATELSRLQEWLDQVRPEDASVLVLAPAGSGKAAAVGGLARRRQQDVVLSNLMELLDQSDPERQLQHLLLLCESQRNAVLYLDRLDGFLQTWEQRHPEAPGQLSELFQRWLERANAKMLSNRTLLVAAGRDTGSIPASLRQAFDRTLAS